MLDCPIDLPVNCRAATVTHVRFLTRNICHTKRFSDSRENETRLVSIEKRLARNETRGGNLPLSGTLLCVVHVLHISQYKYIFSSLYSAINWVR